MYGASELSSGKGRSMRAVAQGLLQDAHGHAALVEEPRVMNENKGVFGLNMLHWWDAEGPGPRPGGAERRARGGMLEPVVAEAFPFDRAGEAHTFIAERRNIGKVVLVP